jgi:hypothetical protein
VFHFGDYIGNSNDKSMQMQKIAEELAQVIRGFNEVYEVESRFENKLDEIVSAAGVGCIEGQVKGAFDYTRDIIAEASERYFIERDTAIEKINSRISLQMTNQNIDYTLMSAQEYYLFYLKPRLKEVRLGVEGASEPFFANPQQEAQEDKRIIDKISEGMDFIPLPEIDQPDPNRQWLNADSPILIQEPLEKSVRGIRVVNQNKTEGGEESCGYHAMHNALVMTHAIANNSNPAANLLNLPEYQQLYGIMREQQLQNKRDIYGSRDLGIVDAQEFISRLGAGSVNSFAHFSGNIDALQKKQHGIAPISVLPLNVDPKIDEGVFVAGSANADDIISLYTLAKAIKDDKQPIDHTFLVSAITENAGHWFALSLVHDKAGKNQWINMDSENNRTKRSLAAIQSLNNILAAPEPFLYRAFTDKFQEEIQARANYIKQDRTISASDQKTLLQVEDQQFLLLSEALKVIEVGELASGAKKPRFIHVLRNIDSLINFYTQNMEGTHKGNWEGLAQDWRRLYVASPAGQLRASGASSRSESPIGPASASAATEKPQGPQSGTPSPTASIRTHSPVPMTSNPPTLSKVPVAKPAARPAEPSKMPTKAVPGDKDSVNLLRSLKQELDTTKTQGVKNMKALFEMQQFLSDKPLNQKTLLAFSDKARIVRSRVDDPKFLALLQKIEKAANDKVMSAPIMAAADKPLENALTAALHQALDERKPEPEKRPQQPPAQLPAKKLPEEMPEKKPPQEVPDKQTPKEIPEKAPQEVPKTEPEKLPAQGPAQPVARVHPAAAKVPKAIVPAKKQAATAAAPKEAAKNEEVINADDPFMQLKSEIENTTTHGIINHSALSQIQHLVEKTKTFDRRAIEELKDKSHALKGQVVRGKDAQLQALFDKIEKTTSEAITSMTAMRLRK